MRTFRNMRSVPFQPFLRCPSYSHDLPPDVLRNPSHPHRPFHTSEGNAGRFQGLENDSPSGFLLGFRCRSLPAVIPQRNQVFELRDCDSPPERRHSPGFHHSQHNAAKGPKPFECICLVLVIGGLLLFIFSGDQRILTDTRPITILSMAFIVTVGTAMGFGCYLSGVRLCGARKASMLSSLEPVVATLTSFLFLHTVFMPMDLAGFAAVLLGCILLSAR